MRVVIYQAADAPARERCQAVIFVSARTMKGEQTEVRLQLTITAPTKELAQARAEAWWAAEQKKRADAAEAKAARDAKRRRPNRAKDQAA
ncbi:hypothetical protein [Labrys neptuniae]